MQRKDFVSIVTKGVKVDISLHWWAALLGLALAIGLILRKLNTTYALMLGAVVGCVIGGATLSQTVDIVVSGTQSVMGTVVRVLAAGVLAGVMMESGAANRIAQTIVVTFGEKLAIFALALATMVICAVGVFIPVAVLIVAPIAIEVGSKMHVSKLALLVALSGGGKASRELPSIGRAMVAPAIAVVLLLINPLGSVLGIKALTMFQVDAMYILPFAAIVGLLAMGQGRRILDYTKAGIARMIDVVMILIGAGALGGLITSSDLPDQIVRLITAAGVPGALLAPIAGILMAAATASTSTGVILGASSFGETILAFGTTPVAAAVTMQAGATVIDALPHGNYFHVSAKSMNMSIGERLGVLPFEALVGLTMTVVAVVLNIVF